MLRVSSTNPFISKKLQYVETSLRAPCSQGHCCLAKKKTKTKKNTPLNLLTICMLLLSSSDFFHFFSSKNSYMNRVSSVLDPERNRRSVGSDLGPNRLQRLSADNKKSSLARKELAY